MSPPRPIPPRRDAARFPSRAALLVVAAFAIVAPRPAPAEDAEGGPSADLECKLRELADRPVEEAWIRLKALRLELRRSAAVASGLYESVESLEEHARLLGAELLTDSTEDLHYRRGQQVLMRLARHAADPDVRIASMRLLASKRYDDFVYSALADLTRNEENGEILIEACLALYALENDRNLVNKPLYSLVEGEDADLRARAALALARIGEDSSPLVEETLHELAEEPTDRGREARLLLGRFGHAGPPTSGRLIRELERKAREQQHELDILRHRRRAAGPAGGWPAVIEEVVRSVLDHSIRRGEVSPRELYLAGIRAILAELDPYSRFLGPEDLRRHEASLAGFYRGFGLRLTRAHHDGPLVVVAAVSGGPAHRAGLGSGDRIFHLNDIATSDFALERFDELLGSVDRLDLIAEPWDKRSPPRPFSLARSRVPTPFVRARLLPDGVAYVRVLSFGRETADEFEGFLAGLIARGATRVVLDLRDNRGGLRSTAIALIKQFVGNGRGLPVATFVGAGGEVQETVYPDARKPRFELPVVVLVNRYTASAAEVVAGSLRDHGVARVVGERTYGKGLEQALFLLPGWAAELIGGKSELVISTREIRLPLGETFHAKRARNGRRNSDRRGGIVPDIVEHPFDSEFDVEDLVEKATTVFSPAVDEFLAAHFPTIVFHQEEGELWDPRKAGEEFDRLLVKLEGKLTRRELRSALRARMRLHLSDRGQAESVGDYSDDRQLQRAILESFRFGAAKLADIPDSYRTLAETHFGSEEVGREGG